MRVLVTGGAGYIGAHVVLDLLDRGHEVVVFDDLSSGHRDNVPREAHFVTGDVTRMDQLDRLLAVTQVDAVFHFAARKSLADSMREPEEYAQQNLIGALNLILTARKFGVRYFVFSSSAAVYGLPEQTPIPEDHPKRPINYYGQTKLQIEEQLAWFSRLRNMRFAALRYFNAAGYDPQGRITKRETKTGNLIPLMMEAASGLRPKLTIFGDDYPTPDGSCIRDYVHVTDLADAHVRALDYLVEQNQDLQVNLGGAQGHSVLEVLSAAQAATGLDIPHEIGARREGDPAILVADPSRAEQLLGWRRRHSDLNTMLQTTLPLYGLSGV